MSHAIPPVANAAGVNGPSIPPPSATLPPKTELPAKSGKALSAPSAKPAVAAKSMTPSDNPTPATTVRKRPWWKFWAKKEVVVPAVSTKVKLPPQPDLAAKTADLPKPAAVAKRVIPPVAKPKGQVKYVSALPEVVEEEALPPIPLEKIEEIVEAQGAQSEMLKAINNGQDAISGAIDKVGLSVTQAAEKAEAANSRLANSISQVDGSIGALRKVSEKSLTSIDHVSSVVKTVEDAVKGMQGEVDKSTKAYDELFEKSQKAEKAHADQIAKLQARSLWVNVLLGLGIVGGIVALVLGG